MDLHRAKTFSKKEHLKSRKQIESLFTNGKTFFVHPVKVYFNVSNRQELSNLPVKVGVSASKRNFKKAVDRNRVKRLLRECYRLNKQDFLSTAYAKNFSVDVFFIYVDKSLPTFDSLQIKMSTCLKRLQKIVEDIK